MEKRDFLEHLTEYMAEYSELGSGFGIAIKRLLDRCDERTSNLLESRKDILDIECVEAAEELCSLSELLFHMGFACAKFHAQEEGTDDDLRLDDSSDGSKKEMN